MKLTIKTLVKYTFSVEIEPSKTVKELKEQIEKEHGKEYPCGAQKLIYNGKILADENKLSEYEFDEKKFIVLMITRAPPAPKPANEESTSKQKTEEKPKPTAAPTRQTPAPTTTAATTTPSTAATTTVSSTPSRLPFPSTTTLSSGPDPPLIMSEPQLAARVANLMTQPRFRHMQDIIQQSPHLLSNTIEQLAASDPEMYNFIAENPDVFVSAINHPPIRDNATTNPGPLFGRNSRTGQTSNQGGTGTPQRSAGQQPAVDQVHVSEHDKEAIERLKELGFSEYLAVQAYMACDKDEQLAANLLFQMEQ